jgi:hypothetical protein
MSVKACRKISDTSGRFSGILDDGDAFGVEVSSLGDHNDDGMCDLAVGAHYDDDGGDLRGAVWVLYLDPLHVLTPSGGEDWPVGSLRTVSWCGEGPVNLSLSVDGGRTFDRFRSNLPDTEFTLRVPHAPTRYALIRLERESPFATAYSDSFFTISSDVDLLYFRVEPPDEIGSGAVLSWSTEPGVEDLAGYRLEKRTAGDAWSTEIDLTRAMSYEDPAAAPGISYRLFAVNGLGGEVSLGEAMLLPSAPLAAWPLPVRNTTLTISFATASGVGGGAGQATIGLYDVAGRLVRSIAFGTYEAGIHSATWDGLDDQGDVVPTGVYFLRVDNGRSQETERVVVIR